MTSVSPQKTAVTRTERGLVIAGTRITLYQLMDYIQAGHPHSLIRQHFPQVAAERLQAALAYIEANWTEVEAEYQRVVKEDEETRQYWERQNRERLAQIANLPPPPGQAAAWTKLQAENAKLASQQ